MSLWTNISGVITVNVFGNTQAHCRYVIETVLAHLPLVTGGGGENMNIHIVQKNGYNFSSSTDEFGQYSNLGNYGRHKHRECSFKFQTEYLIVVEARLCDRVFEGTLREFNKWINRLAKRLWITDTLVKVSAYDKQTILQNTHDVYGKMYELPRFETNGEPSWNEFLWYDHAKNSDFPLILSYKYFVDKEDDAEVERRWNYARLG